MGRLTTHVLDTARGRPAAGLGVALFALTPARRLVAEAITDEDGRLDGPLLAGDDVRPGSYELVFQAGAYHRAAGVPVADPPFLDAVVIRFQIAEPGAHYHVPLLLSPYGYTTYRGS